MELPDNVSEQKITRSLEEARNVLKTEAQAVLDLKTEIDNSFQQAVKMLLNCKGRVVFTGMGKSGHVGRKLAATFSSLGTTAFFVHGAEALHGDLGMITEQDIIIAISNSGETEELLNLLPSLRRIGSQMILMTGNCDSTLGDFADVCLFSGVKEEACSIGLAPTASTTAVMALGDALAIALSHLKGFTPEDFAVYHPGGNLGRRLLTRVKDVLEIREQNPVVKEQTSVKKALFTMTNSNMGSTSVINKQGEITGIVTDGDVRRQLGESVDFLDKPVKKVMTCDPITIEVQELAVKALEIMEDKEINDLPAVKDKKPVGMLNFQDLLRAKIF